MLKRKSESLDRSLESSNIFLSKTKFRDVNERERLRSEFIKEYDFRLCNLPNEILENIHQFLPYKSLLAMRLVSKSFHKLEPRSLGYIEQLKKIPFANAVLIEQNAKQGITFSDYIKLFSATQRFEIDVIRQWTDQQWNMIPQPLKKELISEIESCEHEAPTLERLEQINKLLDQIHVILIKSKINPANTNLIVNNLKLTRFPQLLFTEPTLEIYWKNLSGLRLDKNQLTTLPQEIGQLVSLRSLDISENLLTALPQEFGLLVSLKYLHLQKNQLRSLPCAIGQLDKLLTFLNLSNNKLTILPDELGKLQKIKYLHLNSNELSVLPCSISALTDLETLSLNSNKLMYLPDEFSSSLKNLQELSLEDNQLSESAIKVFKYQFGEGWVKEMIEAQVKISFQPPFQAKF